MRGLYTSESDGFGRKIMPSKIGPRAKSVYHQQNISLVMHAMIRKDSIFGQFGGRKDNKYLPWNKANLRI